MNIKSCLIFLVILLQAFILASCTKQKDNIVITDLKPVIEIKSGNSLIVNLGNFGDEEGVWILNAPKNAKESKIQHRINSSAIEYLYIPLEQFVGKDSVTLLINHDSDGSVGSGVTNTVEINVVVI